ncbi:hypothetical protein PWG15_19545 [Ensifer adhaerens]|uniref:hypothetical protein n=1 Tax=Ensifer adhaerens TaxID=106592 RepID=UPI0023AA0DD9|nr:hypothetical protein [Ensifer adhaerens]WDZ76753.1 hypothetical protein PWG15_19545 [Ensifer adhaerens]
MLIPIQTARAAAATAEDTNTKTQQPAALLPAGQRGEAIQKILDALTRHLSGREILSKDALVRLMEDLARILKFPPLPQEGGRDFVRRLVAFLETMPASDRLLLERQLGGRSLAVRVGLLAELPAVRNGTSAPSSTATPMPAQARDVILRNPSLQPAMPLNPAAARAPVAGEVALLQTVLRKTFGVGNDTEALEPQGDDPDQAGTTEAPSKARNAAPAERSDARASAGKPTSPEGTQVETAAALLAGEGEVEEASQTAFAPERQETVPPTDGGQVEIEAPAGESTAAPAEADATAETAEDADPDGTYGPMPDAEEEKDAKTTTAAGRGNPEARPMRVLFEAIKTLIRDSVALPGSTAGAETRPTAEHADRSDAPAPVPVKEAATPVRAIDAAVRQREVPDGGNALPSVLDDQAEDAKAAQRTPADMRPQRTADEQTMQQVIARLVENGLPREAIPFAMIPYPLAAKDAAEAENPSYEMPGGSEDQASEEDEGAEEGDGDDQAGGAEPMDEALLDDGAPEAPDAYDLYRRLGGLG